MSFTQLQLSPVLVWCRTVLTANKRDTPDKDTKDHGRDPSDTRRRHSAWMPLFSTSKRARPADGPVGEAGQGDLKAWVSCVAGNSGRGGPKL